MPAGCLSKPGGEHPSAGCRWSHNITKRPPGAQGGGFVPGEPDVWKFFRFRFWVWTTRELRPNSLRSWLCWLKPRSRRWGGFRFHVPSNYHLLAPSPLTISLLQGIPRAVSPTWANECISNSRYGPALCNLLPSFHKSHSPKWPGLPRAHLASWPEGSSGRVSHLQTGPWLAGQASPPLSHRKAQTWWMVRLQNPPWLGWSLTFLSLLFSVSGHLSLAFFLLSPSLSAFFPSPLSCLPCIFSLSTHIFFFSHTQILEARIKS